MPLFKKHLTALIICQLLITPLTTVSATQIETHSSSIDFQTEQPPHLPTDTSSLPIDSTTESEPTSETSLETSETQTTETTGSSEISESTEIIESSSSELPDETIESDTHTTEGADNSERLTVKNKSFTKVKNLTELENAIKNKEHVILIANIDITKRIDLFNGFHLIGRNPENNVQHTLTIKNYGAHDHFNMAISNSEFTIEDVSIQNENYYGIVHVGAAYTNVKQRYHDVTYYSNNAQAFWGPNTEVHLSGTSHFTQENGGSRAQEFGEFNRLFISGTARITHDSTSGDSNLSVFMYLTGSTEAGIFIADNADVEIATKKTLFYSGSQPNNLVQVGKNARLKLSIGGNYFNIQPDKNNSLLFEENSDVEIIDTSKTSGKIGINQDRFINIHRNGSLIAKPGSRLRIVSDNRKNLIEVPTAAGHVNFDQVAYADLENKHTNRLFKFYSGASGAYLFYKKLAIQTYEQVNGSLSNSWPSVDATVSYKVSQPTVTVSNSQRFKTEYPRTQNLARLILSPAESLELTHDPVSDRTTTIKGETSSRGTVTITGQFEDGTPLASPPIQPDSQGNFSFPLNKGLKANSTLTFTVQEADLTDLIVETTVADTIGPTAIPLLQQLDLKDVQQPTFDHLVKDLSDNGGAATIELLPPNLINNVGLQHVIARGTDDSGNTTDFKVPVFVYDQDSQVIQTSDTTGFLLKATPFEAYPEEITGDLESLINAKTHRQLWNETEELPSELLQLTDTNLEEIPLPGDYQATYTYLTHEMTVAITILNRGKGIDIMIPKKVLIGSLASQAGMIFSPTYTIHNHGEKAVTLSISNIQKHSQDDFELVTMPSPNAETNQARLLVNTGNNQVLLQEQMEKTFLANIKPQESVQFDFDGDYYGDYLKTLTPNYQLGLVFTQNEE